jgi:hypothetical protein
MNIQFEDNHDGHSITHTVVETPEVEVSIRFLNAVHGGLCIADANETPIIATGINYGQ